jgi:hypothetical protein
MSRLWGDSGRLACRLHRSRVSKAGELAALRFSAPYLAAETRALRTPCPSWLITLVRDRPANSSSGPNRACRFVQESAAAISDFFAPSGGIICAVSTATVSKDGTQERSLWLDYA